MLTKKDREILAKQLRSIADRLEAGNDKVRAVSRDVEFDEKYLKEIQRFVLKKSEVSGDEVIRGLWKTAPTRSLQTRIGRYMKMLGWIRARTAQGMVYRLPRH